METLPILAIVFGPILAFIGAVIGAFMANFLGEDFKRFRDGSALASALSGELKSYRIASARLKDRLIILQNEAKSGNAIVLAEPPPFKDWVFEKAVEKLGYLGPDLPELVCLTYGKIAGFRTLFLLIAQKKLPSDAATLSRLYPELLELVNDAARSGGIAIADLETRANQKYSDYLRSNWDSFLHKCTS